MPCLSIQSVAHFHDALAILGAGVFVFIMTFTAIQSSRSKESFLWAMILSTMFEAVGCATYAIYSQDLTQHIVFLASFATTTIAPCLLAISTFVLFGRYISSALPLEAAISRRRLTTGSSVFIGFQGAIFVALVVSLYHLGSYIDPQPIDGISGALERLSHHEQAVNFLFHSYFLQLVCFSLFAVFTAFWTAKTEHIVLESTEDKKAHRQIFVSVSTINVLCMFRSAYKLAEYAVVDPKAVQLVESRANFWTYDALPILIALVVLCSAFSKVPLRPEAQQQLPYTAIPEIKIVQVTEEYHVGTVKA